MASITLYPHQIKGAEFLASSPFAGLFAGMGTGKTLTALEAIKQVSIERKVLPRVLIIAPPIALPMWREEAASYLDVAADAVQIIKTGKTEIKDAYEILIVSYQIATSRKEALRHWLMVGGVTSNSSIMICDESHALKSVKAKRTKAILGRNGLADGASHTWLLTGTPITRWNDDVYPFLCRADLAGMKARLNATSMEKFQLRYTVRQKRQFGRGRPVSMVVGNRNGDELAHWLYGDGHAMRFDLEEVFKDMPPITKNRYEIRLDADAELKAALKDLEHHSIDEIREKMQTKEPALATIRRQIGMAKAKAAAAEIRERVESGQNVLVGAWHTDVIDALYEELKGYSRGIIDGRTSSANRETTVKEWNLGNVQVVIGQIAAMGVSLNLQQGGSQIIIVEEDWSPSVMDQFYARLWRFGQEQHVHVDILESSTKLDKALATISSAKARAHKRFNDIGKEITDAT